MTDVKAISFDAHGTLILPATLTWRYAAVAAQYGVSCDEDAILKHFLPAFSAQRKRWDLPYGRGEADARAFWRAVVAATFAPLWPNGTTPPAELGDALFDDFGRGEAWQVLPGAREALARAAASSRHRVQL